MPSLLWMLNKHLSERGHLRSDLVFQCTNIWSLAFSSHSHQYDVGWQWLVMQNCVDMVSSPETTATCQHGVYHHFEQIILFGLTCICLLLWILINMFILSTDAQKYPNNSSQCRVLLKKTIRLINSSNIDLIN